VIHDAELGTRDLENLGKSWEIVVFLFISTMAKTRSQSSKSPHNSGDDAPVDPGPMASRKNAYWNPRKEVELLQVLSDNKADMSNKMFKEKVFTEAVKKIEPFYTKGAKKNVKMCISKWKSVRVSFAFNYLYPQADCMTS
jgi:hypothetical protein